MVLMPAKSSAALVVATALVLSLTSCGADTAATTRTAPIQTSPEAADVIDGMFDVGGHSLYLNCQGTGQPTVIYLHGAIPDQDITPHANGQEIQRRLADDHRACVYDRRNVGSSETVDAPQRPEDVLSDLHELLTVAEVEPPYVLLGASFGGLLAYLYANTYPDEVVGMVLLDSMFPDEMELDRYLPPGARYEASDADDECCSLERISHYKTMRAATEHIGKEPEIPVIYLASEQEPWDEQGLGPEYDSRVLALLNAYVGRFSPGKLVWVDAPHFMEPAVPDEIATALHDVIADAGY